MSTRCPDSFEPKGQIELNYAARGLVCAGVDEVGRGCLAGPVYAACCILGTEKLAGLSEEERALIRDSKQLSAKQRLEAREIVMSISRGVAVASASEREIEEINILQASFLAMRRAIAEVQKKAAGKKGLKIDVLLVDGHQKVPDCPIAQETLVKGDSRSFAIAGASILAKIARDDYMKAIAEAFPQYGFDSHVGYYTKSHAEALKEHGPCPAHRRTFAPVRDWQPQT